MTSQNDNTTGTPPSRPRFRVYAAAKTGRLDPNGNEQLGKTREVGAVWSREGKAWDLLSLDLPLNTADAVFFLAPVEDSER